MAFYLGCMLIILLQSEYAKFPHCTRTSRQAFYVTSASIKKQLPLCFTLYQFFLFFCLCLLAMFSERLLSLSCVCFMNKLKRRAQQKMEGDRKMREFCFFALVFHAFCFDLVKKALKK